MQQTDTKRIQEQTQLDGESESLGIVQESEVWQYREKVNVQEN